MTKSIESVSEFATNNYADYKDAFADYALAYFSSMVEMDRAKQISRARVNDIASGSNGYQIDRPLEILVESDEKVALLEEEIADASREIGKYVVAGAAHYHENAAEYHDTAAADAARSGVHISL